VERVVVLARSFARASREPWEILERAGLIVEKKHNPEPENEEVVANLIGDASAVLVNASTRFNDGGQFGLGAEIGISTSKLHAYGPMGLRELTSTKFIVLGQGQVRTA